MHDYGILREIFGSRQPRAKILSNAWQKPLLAKNSLRTLKGIDQYLYSRGKTFTPYVVIVCFTRYTLLFQYVCLLFPICLPCVIFDMYVTRVHAVS